MSFTRRVNCELIATKFAPVPKTTLVQTFFPLDEQVMPDITVPWMSTQNSLEAVSTLDQGLNLTG